MLQTLIKNGACVNSNGVFNGDIAVKDGKIIQIGEKLDMPAEQIIDAAGKLVLPGVIDTHVHLPWPSSSFNSVDDFSSGTTAAACGGVTTIIKYIVPDDSGRIIPDLEKTMAEAQDASFVDYSFHLILRKVTDQTIAEMAEAVRRGFTSFKIYTAYSGFHLSDQEILTSLKTAKDLGALVCFHAEDGHLVSFASEQLIKNGKTDMRYFTEAHPRLADIEATHKVIAYARQTHTRIHIVHVNTSEGAKLIDKARRSGLPVSGETCPHYLIFTEEVYKTGEPEANYYVLAPVIRKARDRQALWQAIAKGGLQTIATDHCPYNNEQKLKNRDFHLVPGGASGIETSLAALYTHGVSKGKISIQKLVELMSANPARIFNLYPKKGVIAVGSDADFVIYDPEGSFKIDAEKLHSNSDNSIYQGMKMIGRPVQTILNGQVIAENGELTANTPGGQLLVRPQYQ
jgi:dihydropyrimidinase